MAKGERVDKNEAGEAGREQKVKSLDAKLRNLDLLLKTVTP